MPRLAAPSIDKDRQTREAYVSFQLEAVIKKLDENAERQSKWEGRIEEKLATMEKRINDIPEKYVSKMELKDKLSPLESDIGKINDNTTWIVRIVLMMVVVALLSLVVVNRNGLGGL